MDDLIRQTSQRAAGGQCPYCKETGCSCREVVSTFSESVCKSCSTSPCSCESQALSLRASSGVCNVCHRSTAMCICKSHHVVRPKEAREALESLDDEDAVLLPPGQRDEKAIRALVNEGMYLYYDRDAAGLAKWIRRCLR